MKKLSSLLFDLRNLLIESMCAVDTLFGVLDVGGEFCDWGCDMGGMGLFFAERTQQRLLFAGGVYTDVHQELAWTCVDWAVQVELMFNILDGFPINNIY